MLSTAFSWSSRATHTSSGTDRATQVPSQPQRASGFSRRPDHIQGFPRGRWAVVLGVRRYGRCCCQRHDGHGQRKPRSEEVRTTCSSCLSRRVLSSGLLTIIFSLLWSLITCFIVLLDDLFTIFHHPSISPHLCALFTLVTSLKVLGSVRLSAILTASSCAAGQRH
jgi:hypothetical protein